MVLCLLRRRGRGRIFMDGRADRPAQPYAEKSRRFARQRAVRVHGRQEFRPEEIQFVDEDPIRKRSRTYDKGELDISLKDGRHIEIKYADGLTMAKERLLELKTLAQAGLETNALSGEEMTEVAKG